MYHFTIIDEASTEIQSGNLVMQEEILEKAKETQQKSKNLFRKTAHFLHRYLDQPNCVRIYISKN